MGAAGGLTSAEALERLERDGANVLPAPPRTPGVRRLAAQLVHFFALMLWGAAALAMVAGLPQLTIAIAAVVVVNAIFAFAQEQRATRAAERLRSLLPRNVAVRRDGVRTDVSAVDVVVGDVLLLEAGDRIAADAQVVSAHGLRVDTSMLTGESEPVDVEGGPVHGGTFVVEGEADAEVTATGASTRIAAIAHLLDVGESPESPLTTELRRVVRMIAAIAVGIGALFFVVWTVAGNSADEGLVFAIGVTVALVPEALLPTVTLALAFGAEQMAKRNVLVRDLAAVETLGSTTFICTDKTGTLTRNHMTVVDTWTAAGVTDAALLRAAVRCSTGHVRVVDGVVQRIGDPMEIAIDELGRDLGLDTEAERAIAAGGVRFPFDPRRRRMSVTVAGEVVAKGAPDAVLGFCATVPPEAAVELERLTEKGLRVLAVARRPAATTPAAAADAEAGLDLLGLLALEDPPRPGARAAVARCRQAGVRIAMVTGDHPTTAATIATEVGLRDEGGVVVVGDELPQDEQLLGALLDRDGIVVARATPEHKVRIARALRARGHVVAMTGDGVNDGPALHEADIGVAMGLSGTDVAREAADLVLLDDDFASIVGGIEQGRATFVNVRRFLTYHLTDNVAELTPFLVWALSGGRFPLALGVMQILALDLGTDTASAVALGAEPPAAHLLDGPPVSGRLLDRKVLRRAFGVLGPTEAGLTMLAFVVALLSAGWRPGDAFPDGAALTAASGAAFITVVVAQTGNAWACRSSTRWPGALGWGTNRLLLPAATAELVFSLLVLVVPVVAKQLDHSSPPLAAWLVAVASGPVLLLVDALEKRRRAQRAASRR